MSNINKAKLSIILLVMLLFTSINLLKDNDWLGYLFSLVIFPLITWGVIEFCIWKLKKE